MVVFDTGRFTRNNSCSDNSSNHTYASVYGVCVFRRVLCRGGIAVRGRGLRGCFGHRRVRGGRQVVKGDGFGLLRSGRGLFPAGARGRQQHGAQGGGDEDEVEREHDEQRIEDVRPHRRERRADGIGDDAEYDAAARSLGEPLACGGPAAGEIPAVALREEALGGRRMHDEEHRGEQQHGAQQPAGGDELLPRDEHGGTIDGKQKERVDKVPRKPHEEGGDGEPDVAEHIAPRDGDKEEIPVCSDNSG